MMVECDTVLSCGCAGWDCAPARRSPQDAWEPVENVTSVDTKTHIAIVYPEAPLARWQTARMDGVRLFCKHGEVHPDRSPW
jgi:hypothetical protein